MPINELYNTWKMRIRQLRPNERITRIRNITWLIVGIYQSRSVCLSRVAGKIPTSAKLLSTTRRMSRLLSNPAIQVREWYEPIAREWLETQFRHIGEIRLIVDGTKIGFGHQLLIVGLAYRKRAILLLGHGSGMSKGIAQPGNNWPCWLMYAVCFLLEQPSFWSETANLAL